MIKSDFHTHTSWCDGKDTPRAMVLSAIEKGLTAFGLSGHSYTSFDEDYCMSVEGTRKYRKEVEALKSEFSGAIDIYCGIEQDIFAEEPENPFDYMIGSVHYLKRGGCYPTVDYTEEILKDLCNEYFKGNYIYAAECYFDTVAQVVDRTGCDIIGHFDLFTKFNEGDRLFSTKDPNYIKAWQSAADELLRFNKPFEINTGAVAKGYRKEPYPSMDIIKYIVSKGGVFILSSDAHSADKIAYGFADVLKKLDAENIAIAEFRP